MWSLFMPSRLQPGITGIFLWLMPAKEGGNYVNPGSTVFSMLHTWVLATNSFFQKLAACVCVWSLTALCLKIVCPSELGAIVQRWTNSRDGYALCLLRQPNIQSSHPLSHLMPSIYTYGGCTLYTLPREWRTWHTWNKMRILKVVVMKISWSTSIIILLVQSNETNWKCEIQAILKWCVC